jgi:peptidoglycan/xylan/chitin deacetylase (PgdA/CDA1 family)
MLNHRNTSILFVVILVALNGVNMAYSIHWLWFVIATVLFGSIEFYGAYFVYSNFHIKAICKVNTDKKLVALTFDDGPMEGRTQKVLDVLQKHNVKATFFCIGNHIKGNEAILKLGKRQCFSGLLMELPLRA